MSFAAKSNLGRRKGSVEKNSAIEPQPGIRVNRPRPIVDSHRAASDRPSPKGDRPQPRPDDRHQAAHQPIPFVHRTTVIADKHIADRQRAQQPRGTAADPRRVAKRSGMGAPDHRVSLPTMGSPLPHSPSLRVVSPQSQVGVARLPRPKALPVWLRLLVKLQRGSLLVAFVLVIAALAAYGRTVYLQQLWSREYGELEKLQRSERELMTAIEALKNHSAAQAGLSSNNLVAQSPGNTIFLPPAPLRRLPSIYQPQPEAQAPAPSPPIGY